jgi:hypothetical protein
MVTCPDPDDPAALCGEWDGLLTAGVWVDPDDPSSVGG